MGVNSVPKTVTRQRRDCDLNPGPSAPESSTLTTRLPSHSRLAGFIYLLFYFTASPICGTRGIMLSTCPSVCACVLACVSSLVKAFSDRFAVDFKFIRLCISLLIHSLVHSFARPSEDCTRSLAGHNGQDAADEGDS